MTEYGPVEKPDGSIHWDRQPGERRTARSVREFVQEAHDKAKATTDDEVREQANAPASDPRSIARFSYAQGLRDGVVMACEQMLARIDQENSRG